MCTRILLLALSLLYISSSSIRRLCPPQISQLPTDSKCVDSHDIDVAVLSCFSKNERFLYRHTSVLLYTVFHLPSS